MKKKDHKNEVEAMREQQRKKNKDDERHGLRCPVCGCRDFLTDHTVPIPGAVRRYKWCRHCGKKIRTKESVETKKDENI